MKNSFDVDDRICWLEAYNEAVDNGMSIDEATETAWMTCRYLSTSRYVCANVSTEVVDAENDLADVKAYVEAGQELVKRGGILTRNHSNKVIGTVWKVCEGVDEETGKPCVVSFMNYFRDSPLYDESWKQFLRGRTEFSIGSYIEPHRECSITGCYTRLIPTEWFELSNVDKGINPRTYPIDVNNKEGERVMERMKGKIVDLHEDVCPVKAHYLKFKEAMEEKGYQTNYGEDFILIHGLLGEDEIAYVYQEYPDIRQFEILKGDEEDGEDLTLIIPKPVDDMDDMLHDMVHLIMDEQEAIEGYRTILVSLAQGTLLDTEQYEKVSKIFHEVMGDEEEHIGNILEVINLINPKMYEKIADGMKEAQKTEAKKGECPAGQHEHAGVIGCHDIFRRHHTDDKTNPTDKLDITDENIDVNAIRDAPTAKLKEIVQRVGRVLAQYSDDAVQEFLASTPGKEFILAFLELKRRKINGENNMAEIDAANAEAEKGEETPVVEEPEVEAPEAEKGVTDVQSSIANIASTLASITGVVDQINIRLMKLEENSAEGTEHTESITDAIGSLDVAPEEEAGAVPGAPVAPESADEAAEDKGVPPQFEKTEDATEETTEETEEESEEESEKPPVAEGGDDKEADDESEDKEESKDEESSDEDKSSESEDKKSDDEEKTEEKTEDKSEDDSEKKKDKEKEKGSKEEAPVAEPAPADAPAEAEKAEPVAPTDGSESAVPKEAGQEEPTVNTPQPEVVKAAPAPAEAPVDDFVMPIPKGGQVVDFRAMYLKRQEELRNKGVELYVAEPGTPSSLASVPVAPVSGSNVSLVYPSNNVKAFNEASGVNVAPKSMMKDALKLMGTTDSSNFLNKLIGE